MDRMGKLEAVGATFALLVLGLPGCTDAPDSEPLQIDMSRVYDDLAWLADDARAGREVATAGNEAALDYVSAVLEELGLEPAGEDGFRQTFEQPAWALLDTPTLSIGDTALAPGEDFGPLKFSGSADVETTVTFVGYGMTVAPFDPSAYPDCPLSPSGWDDYGGIRVRGKVVLVLYKGPHDDEAIADSCPPAERFNDEFNLWYPAYKAANARDHGAAAMLIVGARELGTWPSSHIGGLYEPGGHYLPHFASMWVDTEVARTLFPNLTTWAAAADEAPASVATHVSVDLSTSTMVEMRQTANLVAVLPAEHHPRAREAVVLGAHIDHLGVDPLTGDVYNGAFDNASGSAVLLELARIAALGGTVPERNVVFAWFNAEEYGMTGASAQVADPAHPLDDTIAMINFDGVGSGWGLGVSLHGVTEEPQRWLGDLSADASAQDGLEWILDPRPPALNSDQVWYANAGVPAVMVSSMGPAPYYHTPNDTLENIEPTSLQAATEVVWSGLERLMQGTEDDL